MSGECANPLLLQWLKEWWDIAKEQNSKGALTYKKAYDSVKACPIAFEHPSQAQQLRGLGPKICDRLTEKLIEHCQQNGLPRPEDPQARGKKRTGEPQTEPAAEPAVAPKKARRAQSRKQYVPSLRSGGYAIVLALSTLPEGTESGLTKNQIIDIAEPHCDSSFLAPSDPTKTYTAWSSMRTLQDKDLVFVTGGATKRYALTEDGWAVAQKMRGAANLNNEKIRDPNGANSEQAALAPISLPQPPSGLVAPTVDAQKENRPPPSSQKSKLYMDLSDLEGDEHASANEPTRRRQEAEPALPIPKKATHSAKSRKADGFVELSSSSPRLLPMKASKLNRVAEVASKSQADGSGSIRNFQREKPSLQIGLTNKEPLQPVSASSNGCQTVFLPPDSFTVELLLDNREVRSKTDRTYVQDGLLAQGVTPTTRALELGDCTWVARVHDPNVLRQLGLGTNTLSATGALVPMADVSAEFVLDHVVERKRLDDLISSLKDGRFHEQKFRLRRSGARHVTYLIEEIALAPEVAQRWRPAVHSALASTIVIEQFAVVRTRRLDDSIRWLARLTRALRAHYAGKGLHVLTATGLDALESGARTRRDADACLATLKARLEQADTDQTFSSTSPAAPGLFLSYPAFAGRAAKQDGLALRDVFLKMLLCVKGLSGDKAIAVQRQWPTPRAFCEAYIGVELKKQRDGPDGTQQRGQVERGGGMSIADQSGRPQFKADDQKRRAEMVFRATGSLAGRQRVGKVVSARVAEVWGGLIPTSED